MNSCNKFWQLLRHLSSHKGICSQGHIVFTIYSGYTFWSRTYNSRVRTRKTHSITAFLLGISLPQLIHGYTHLRKGRNFDFNAFDISSKINCPLFLFD